MIRATLSLILALLAPTAHAWGTQGHQVIASLALAQLTAKAKAGIDETRKVEIRRYPDETDRIQRIVDSLLKLVGVTATPSMGMPREVREALAKFGVATRPGNVRLPPLPPLWR